MSKRTHALEYICELKRSWLTYKEVKMPQKKILKVGFKAQKCKIAKVQNKIQKLI